jgi:hypothetical protein
VSKARICADAQFIEHIQRWLERAVIGLNLCPFAKSVHVKRQIHYTVSAATLPDDLLPELEIELNGLVALDPIVRDTTLLIAPDFLLDFLDFNDFLHDADRLLRKLRLEGVLQIASFHPRFQFANTEVDDITNYTNRAPYPVLHLLREDSIARAVHSFPDAAAIFEKNMETLEGLGHAGWEALGLHNDKVSQ